MPYNLMKHMSFVSPLMEKYVLGIINDSRSRYDDSEIITVLIWVQRISIAFLFQEQVTEEVVVVELLSK